MSRKVNTVRRTLRTALSGGFVSLMVVIYLAGAIQFNAIHATLHASAEEVLHSPENEKEACHQAIYHQVPEGSCQHKTHLVANDKCSLCDLIVPAAYLLVDETHQDLTQHNSPIQIPTYSCSYQDIIALLPSRAPPVCPASAS
jgi:hypothetical protein